jgi:hypothetical protein
MDVRQRRTFTIWERVRRLAHLRLMIPIKRSRHPPEFAARGVAIGLFWAFTPLVGIQLYLVLLTWLVARLRADFNFSLIIAMAWTWVTNVFTLWPTYYVYYLTGRILMGNWTFSTGYREFVDTWQSALGTDQGLLQAAISGVTAIAREQGLPLLIGCIPYAIGSAWLGYRWSLAYVRRRRARALVRANAVARAESSRANDTGVRIDQTGL